MTAAAESRPIARRAVGRFLRPAFCRRAGRRGGKKSPAQAGLWKNQNANGGDGSCSQPER